MTRRLQASVESVDGKAFERLIPVIVDVPRADPGLGFEKYVSAIASAIMGGQPAQYTVGLYGPWGTGKSSILLALMEKLKNHGSAVTAVTFDAWRHQQAHNLLAPLMWTLKGAFDQQTDDRVPWRKIFGGLELQAFGFGFRVPAETDVGGEATGAVEDYMEAIQSFAKIGQSLEKDHRIVVLVDDLDRCSPDRVIEVVEAIRLLMDVPGFVFVVAIDYDVLIDAVETRYPHADPHRFVEKIVQVPFRIPNINPNVNDYLHQVVVNWTQLRKEWFTGLPDEEIRSVIGLALRDNPRQIKRILNSYMVARHIDWDGLARSESKAKALLSSLAMQLRWPDEFEELVADIRRYRRGQGSKVPNPILAAVETYKEWIATGDDEIEANDDRRDFVEFLRRHLDGQLSLRIVDEAMRIASDVSGGDAKASETPEERRRGFMGKVMSLFADQGHGFEVRQQGDTASLLSGGEVLVRILNVRSVPRTFDLKVRNSIIRADYKPPVAHQVEGEWTLFHFDAGARHLLDDVLDDASSLISYVQSQVR